jgi:hypothetical protein
MSEKSKTGVTIACLLSMNHILVNECDNLLLCIALLLYLFYLFILQAENVNLN